MSRYARRQDGNHAAIRDYLRARGVWVLDTHHVGSGFPDLLCVWPRRKERVVLLEVKDPAQPPSRRALTPDEVKFHAGYPGPLYVVETPEQAWEAVTAHAETEAA